MNNTEHCIKVCNKLLRGERSAVETYDQAIDKFRDQPFVNELQRLRENHSAAVLQLEENVLSMGGRPDTDSGIWGAFANVIQATANVLGSGAALEALQQGEKSGESEYVDALNDEHVLDDCKVLISTRLLPQSKEHVMTLGHLKG